MFFAMRGKQVLVEGSDLEQVVIAAESYSEPGNGDIIVWGGSYVVAEIEDMGDEEEPYTKYTGREKLMRRR